MEKKILFNNKWFDVISIDKMIGVEPQELNVVIMPFERDVRGLPKSLGILKEYNPMRSGNYSMTLITGNAEGEDPDVLATAIRELKEESGYDVPDPDRWFYLGMMTASKIVKQEHPCFAVDVTGLTAAEKEGDGSEGEKKSEFLMSSVKEALRSNDAYIPTLFLKMFLYIWGFDLEKTDETPNDKANIIKKRLDILYLNLDGVNGSLVMNDIQGDPYIEYTVKEITDDIRNIPEESDGIKIRFRIISDETPIENTQTT